MSLKSKGIHMPFNIENILLHYIVCALWSTNDDSGLPLDVNYSSSDVHEDSLQKMRTDVTNFVTANEKDLIASGLSDSQIGHDFWLTRNGYGTGFWDRDLGDAGDRLSVATKIYSQSDLYIDDSGKLFV